MAMNIEDIRAEIIGSDRCEADGFTVRAAAPVLAMCRKLIEAGYDRARPLNAYRGDVLALKVSSIGYGARYTVREGNNAPYIARWKPFALPDVSPRIARNEVAAIHTSKALAA
jgi:hypothetical protein